MFLHEVTHKIVGFITDRRIVNLERVVARDHISDVFANMLFVPVCYVDVAFLRKLEKYVIIKCLEIFLMYLSINTVFRLHNFIKSTSLFVNLNLQRFPKIISFCFP